MARILPRVIPSVRDAVYPYPDRMYTLVSEGYKSNWIKRMFEGQPVARKLLLGHLTDLILGPFGDINPERLLLLRYQGNGTFEYVRNGFEPEQPTIIDFSAYDDKKNLHFYRPHPADGWTLNFGISGIVDIQELYKDKAVVSFRFR